MKLSKVFEFIAEIIVWFQIVMSPTLICFAIGSIIYFMNPGETNLIIAIGLIFIGLVGGILYANKIWRTKGTVSFISRVSASPELDTDSNDK
ncbi:hypothetical protein [Flavobacterium sp. N1994]|uniref:hypothetical protein n=1 Tax=Flavobacterium sp. N1994 TaxID=2986827 RepID=UPI0022232472|nr:hypothetical protein [Flavobacterium sp. N1994]